MSQNFIYDCRWSNDVNDKFIEDYNLIQDTVFNNKYDKELFKKKFIDNIYGPSIMVIVYDCDKPIGARTFWRNDINNKEAYQPGDVCVLKEYRGKGLFRGMSEIAYNMLSQNVIIYNFPNKNSFPGYIKMGNKLLAAYYPALFTPKKYHKEHTLLLDEEYANWWFASRTDFRYIKKKGRYYLVAPYALPMMYMVLAEVKKELAMKYKKSIIGIYFYRSTKASFYNRKRRPVNIVCKYDNIDYIPTWKVDSLGY